MTGKVVDASAVVALLFDEPARDEVVPRLRDASLHAPSLIAFEAANACVKKMRARPTEGKALIDAFSFFDELAIAQEPVDLSEAIVLAERTGLSLHDAAYLWLARALGVELVTLDARVASVNQALR